MIIKQLGMRILTFFLLIVSSLALRTAFNGRTRVHHGGLLSSACRRVLRMTTTVNPATVEYEAAKQQVRFVAPSGLLESLVIIT